ncbi:MAG: site-specific integrase [Planctomycetales bacterium]|nr:site-specific integrase [Planctomycetales bacterium]MBN8627914.1 site-specific integrase [Planctomycetota bacterium]
MASITKESNGRRTVQFVGTDGKRRSIRLGKVTQRAAESVKLRVELILSAAISGHALDDATARWLSELDQTMIDKLAAVGLAKPRESMTLSAFIEDYIAGRSDIKDRTTMRLREAGQKLMDCFGANKPLREFASDDGAKFRQWLLAKGLAENTVRRNCGRAKQFFRAAIHRKLVAENPFAELVSAVRGNPARMRFIDRETAAKVFEACPNAEWRLIFALSRFGGLRCPSETLSLKWSDIDWKNERVRVPSPKTEHIEGKESRMIPLFPELRPYLEEVRAQAKPDSEYVIMHYRSVRQNLSTQFERIVCRAGLEPWPKLFQNLRSTRETELMEDYPAHVVCAWIGNSEAVARKHYLQITDEHFAKAAGKVAETAPPQASALQNPVQQTAEQARTAPHAEMAEAPQTPLFPVFAELCELVHKCTVPLRGFEPRLTD